MIGDYNNYALKNIVKLKDIEYHSINASTVDEHNSRLLSFVPCFLHTCSFM